MRNIILIIIVTILYLPSCFSKQLILTTYNTGLAHDFVPYASKRFPHIVDSLKKIDTDILCLQEVWQDKDREIIIKELKTIYPYAHYSSAAQRFANKAPVCGLFELFGRNSFGMCMLRNCLSYGGDKFTDCVLNTCGGQLRKLKESNRQCATALMSLVGRSVVKGVLSLLNPYHNAGLFAYEGRTGIIILSKFPLDNRSQINMTEESTLNQREVLSASIKFEDKKHQIFCAHLTANLEKKVPYTGTSLSWKDENHKQILKILAKLNDINGPLYLMGDFNCSIEDSSANVLPEFPENCRMIMKSGFKNHFMKENNQCTFCPFNKLNEQSENYNIDHIFIKGVKAVKSKIILNKPIMIRTEDGKTIETNLSDHFGVRLVVEI